MPRTRLHQSRHQQRQMRPTPKTMARVNPKRTPTGGLAHTTPHRHETRPRGMPPMRGRRCRHHRSHHPRRRSHTDKPGTRTRPGSTTLSPIQKRSRRQPSNRRQPNQATSLTNQHVNPTPHQPVTHKKTKKLSQLHKHTNQTDRTHNRTNLRPLGCIPPPRAPRKRATVSRRIALRIPEGGWGDVFEDLFD